jgi:hypothetical protein
MSANTGRLGKVGMKKEATYGTYIEADIPLRVTTFSVDRKIEHTEDPALIGEVFPTDLVKVGDRIEGSVEAMAHPEEIGLYLHMAMGEEAAVANPAQGYLFITYTGSEDYADIVVSSNSLTASVGDDVGTKAADTNFNTTGTIDLTTGSFDTLAEVATAINGYTGWQASYKGLASADTSQIADLAAYKLKEAGVYVRTAILECTVVSTAAKKHAITPADADANLPSYSFMEDLTLGTGEALAYTGMKSTGITLSASAGDLVKLSNSLKGYTEEASKTYPALTIPTYTAYKAANTTVYINGTAFTVAKDFSLNLNPNLDDSKVLGSYYNQEPIRQANTAEISGNLFLNTTTWGYRSNYTEGDKVEVLIYMETEAYADTGNTVVFATLIRLNQVILTQYASSLNTPDRLTIAFAGSAVNSANHDTVEISVVDDATSTY